MTDEAAITAGRALVPWLQIGPATNDWPAPDSPAWAMVESDLDRELLYKPSSFVAPYIARVIAGLLDAITARDATDTPDLRARYDVLLGENNRLRGEIARLDAEVKALRPPPEPARPRTFGDDTVATKQDRYNQAMTDQLNREATDDLLREIADLKLSVIAFCAPWAGKYARDFGLPDGHLHPTHYDILARCGARMDDFVRAEIPDGR